MGALVLFSLAVGTAIDAAVSPYSGKQTGENSLLRTLHGTLNEGDVLVLNRYFSGWFDIALLQQRGVNVVVRKHQLRAIDFRTRQRLGKDDQLVVWAKPTKPKWMDSETCKSLPETFQLREIRFRVTRPGFRTKSLIIVTTLLDSDEYVTHSCLIIRSRHYLGQAGYAGGDRWNSRAKGRRRGFMLQRAIIFQHRPQRWFNDCY